MTVALVGFADNGMQVEKKDGKVYVSMESKLMLMRATAIVKLILQYGPAISPTCIEAAGHGLYRPKVDNSSRENKAQNRRTEIILTPKLSDVLQMLGEQ